MKKILFIILGTICFSCAYSQDKSKDAERDSLLNELIDQVWSIKNELSKKEMSENYKIYKTSNIYNFLRLNTATGQIIQVQWSMESNQEGYVTINDEDLSLLGKHSGTFELYPTENMYQYLLVDQKLGRIWHVQWGFEKEKRWIRQIVSLF